MPIDFAQILKDEKEFPNELELTVGNEKVPLGALRELNKRQQAELAEQLAATQRQREAAAAQQREFNEVTEKATGIYNSLQQQLDQNREEAARAATRNQTGGYDPEQLYQTDVYYSPLRKRNDAHEEALKKLADRVELIANTQLAMGKVYTEDRLASEYEATAEARKRSKAIADWDLPKLRKYAEENRINDRLGLASIREAVNRLTEGERKQEESQAAYERGLREGEMRTRMGMMPRPASPSAAVANGAAPAKDLDEALSPESLAQDPDLMRMFAELQQQGGNFMGEK